VTTIVHTHQTAPTQFVEANGIRSAYRRFGKPDGASLVSTSTARQYQYPRRFVQHVSLFLSEEEAR
jgi:hypothetical protein